jgi:hypothetical protein
MQIMASDYSRIYKYVYTNRTPIYHSPIGTLLTAREYDGVKVYIFNAKHEPQVVHIFHKDQLLDYIDEVMNNYMMTVNNEEDEYIREILTEKIEMWRELKIKISKEEEEM